MARVIRFMFDYGHLWPLWEDENDQYTMDPSDYGLSAELTERLKACYEYWELHRDIENGWVSPESRRRWYAETDQAVAILRREVAQLADVRDERE